MERRQDEKMGRQRRGREGRRGEEAGLEGSKEANLKRKTQLYMNFNDD